MISDEITFLAKRQQETIVEQQSRIEYLEEKFKKFKLHEECQKVLDGVTRLGKLVHSANEASFLEILGDIEKMLAKHMDPPENGTLRYKLTVAEAERERFNRTLRLSEMALWAISKLLFEKADLLGIDTTLPVQNIISEMYQRARTDR